MNPNNICRHICMKNNSFKNMLPDSSFHLFLSLSLPLHLFSLFLLAYRGTPYAFHCIIFIYFIKWLKVLCGLYAPKSGIILTQFRNICIGTTCVCSNFKLRRFSDDIVINKSKSTNKIGFVTIEKKIKSNQRKYLLK